MKRIFRSFNEMEPVFTGDSREYRLTAEFVNDDNSLIRPTPELPTIFTATYRVSRSLLITSNQIRSHVEERLHHEINAKMDYALQQYAKPVHPLKAWLESHR